MNNQGENDTESSADDIIKSCSFLAPTCSTDEATEAPLEPNDPDDEEVASRDLSWLPR